MVAHGPWIQPDDTWAVGGMWLEGGLDTQGLGIDDPFDPAQFQASVDEVIAGTNVVFTITVGDPTNNAYSPSTSVAHFTVEGGAGAATGRLYVFQPRLEFLAFDPVGVPFDDWPTGAITYEVEEPEGTPLPGTIKIYGYVMHRSNDVVGTTRRGSSIRRLTPTDYTLDGSNRAVTTWVQALTPSGPILATFDPPAFEDTYQTDPFEITDLTPDANGFIVFSIVTDALHSTWTVNEGHSAQLLRLPLVSPPSVGILPLYAQLYTPPRYRFIYDGRPPLAHRQRPDGVNIAGPPLAHIQGGASTAITRPPLAHRQNSP